MEEMNEQAGDVEPGSEPAATGQSRQRAERTARGQEGQVGENHPDHATPEGDRGKTFRQEEDRIGTLAVAGQTGLQQVRPSQKTRKQTMTTSLNGGAPQELGEEKLRARGIHQPRRRAAASRLRREAGQARDRHRRRGPR